MFKRGDGDDRHDQPINPAEVGTKDGQATEVTVVGQGARLEGTVVSAGSLRIDGQVDAPREDDLSLFQTDGHEAVRRCVPDQVRQEGEEVGR